VALAGQRHVASSRGICGQYFAAGKIEFYTKVNKFKVLTTLPYIAPDDEDPASAWSILLLHHKHYSQLNEIFPDTNSIDEQEQSAVEVLKKKIADRNLDNNVFGESYDKTLAKQKRVYAFLQTMAKSAKDGNLTDLNDDEDITEIDEEIRNDPLYEYGDSLLDKSQDYIGLQKALSVHGTHVVNRETYIQAKDFISSLKKAASEAREEELNTYHNFRYDPDGLLGSSSTPIQNRHTIIVHDLFNQFNSEQREAFNVISAHLLEQECCKTENNPKGQLRMFISGEGGTGKSKLVEAIVLHARTIYGHDGSQHGCVLVVGPTGISAFNVGGRTIQSALYTMQLRTCKDNPKFIQKIQTQLGTIRLLLIDEVSMIAANMMNDIDIIFKLAKNQPSKILGGIHFVLLGDFYQLPPVKKYVNIPLYTKQQNGVGVNFDRNRAGLENVYDQITTFVELIHNFRAQKDPTYVQHLQLVRKGIATVEQQEFFKTRTFQSLDSDEITKLPADTLFVSSTKKICALINRSQDNRLVNEKNKPEYIWAQHRYASKKS